jgi:hypothetical protein
MYSITENIYYSQLSSVAILLQPEPVSHRIIQGKDWVHSPYVLSSCGLPLPPTCLLVTVNQTRSYFASTVQVAGWASELVWTQTLEEKSSASAGDRTPVVQSVVRHYTD